MEIIEDSRYIPKEELEKAFTDSVRSLTCTFNELNNSDDALSAIFRELPILAEIPRRLDHLKLPEYVDGFAPNQPAWLLDADTNTIKEVVIVRSAYALGEPDYTLADVRHKDDGSISTVSTTRLFYTQEDAEIVSYMRKLHDKFSNLARQFKETLFEVRTTITVIANLDENKSLVNVEDSEDEYEDLADPERYKDSEE